MISNPKRISNDPEVTVSSYGYSSTRHEKLEKCPTQASLALLAIHPKYKAG